MRSPRSVSSFRSVPVLDPPSTRIKSCVPSGRMAFGYWISEVLVMSVSTGPEPSAALR